MKIFVLKTNGYYIPDSKGGYPSNVLFDHISNPSEVNNYNKLHDLTRFKIMAEAHGWEVEVRNDRGNDIENDGGWG